MNGVDVIRAAIGSSHFWFDGTVGDVDGDQANFVPTGVTHPIGQLAVHVVNSEDTIVRQLFLGQPTEWEAGGWEAKLGYPGQFFQDETTARALKVKLQELEPYKAAVYANTEAWLAALTEAELSRELDMSGFGMGTMPLGQVAVTLFIANTIAHTGEISALKGLHSAKGYPF